MFEAKLHDPAHGTTKALAKTAEEAVELAFTELAEHWVHPNDLERWRKDTPHFNGEIREGLVWWNHGSIESIIGAVRPLRGSMRPFVFVFNGQPAVDVEDFDTQPSFSVEAPDLQTALAKLAAYCHTNRRWSSNPADYKDDIDRCVIVVYVPTPVA